MTEGTRKYFKYIKCQKCSSVSRDTEADIRNLYDRYPNSRASSLQLNKIQCLLRKTLLRKNFASKLILKLLYTYDDLKLKSLYPLTLPITSRILDVGCGDGSLVYCLRQLGYMKSKGIDPYLDIDSIDEKSRQFLARQDFEDIQDSYDLIMFHHSLEHFIQPQAALKHACSILSPGGIVIVRIPNVDSDTFEHFGTHWDGLHPPYHVTLPSRDGMNILAEQAGLVVSDCRGEQLLSMVLNSINHSKNISDFEPLGIRTFMNSNPRSAFIFKAPTTITRSEINQWRQQQRIAIKDLCSDWICYYLQHKEKGAHEKF